MFSSSQFQPSVSAFSINDFDKMIDPRFQSIAMTPTPLQSEMSPGSVQQNQMGNFLQNTRIPPIW
jgi:hypothetical protein